MLAEDGRCKTLDEAADGYVRAEGVGALALRRLADVQADGAASSSRVLALLAGTAVNQDGRSSSLTAPNGPSQQAVISSALAAAGVSALDVASLEMHGTGTPLGDPIEAFAALSVYTAASSPSQPRGSARTAPIALTALKSQVGHAEPAAGLLGVLRAAGREASRQASPLLHLRGLNPLLGPALVLTRTDGSHGGAAAGSLALLPRQAAPQPGGVGGATGVSGFAFQASRCPRPRRARGTP